MNETIRTVKLKLIGDPTRMNQVLENYIKATNWLSPIVFERKIISNPNKLSRELYTTVREQFDTPSQVSQSLFRHVISTYKTAKSNNRWKLAVFKKPTIPICWKRDFNVSSRGLTIWGQRFTYQSKSVPEGQWSDSKLKRVDGQWYLILCVTIQIPDLKTQGCIVGVDSGIKNIFVATNSNNGQTFNFSSNSLNHKRSCVRQTKSRVASVGTPSSRRLLRRLAGKEKSVTQEILHLASKKLVAWAVKQDARTIVMEELNNIRDSSLKKGKEFRAKVHRWPYAKAQFFVQYKGASQGIGFELVDPAYSSQRCPCCGHTERANRNGLVFKCKVCGHQDNSDRVGGRNISLRSVLQRQAVEERATVNSLIVMNEEHFGSVCYKPLGL